MQAAVDAIWDELAPAGVSWVGFYEKVPGAEEMILTARRDKPACSPIGLHGACGRCWTSRRMLVVRDVANLGKGYIACDPRDRSEVVVPMFDPTPQRLPACWGVLDLDGYDVGSFDADDARQLQRACAAAGLTTHDQHGGTIEII